MNSYTNKEDHISRMSKSSHSTSPVESKPSGGPTVLFFWMWNWFAGLPKTVTNLFADIKSGELLARFTLLDAMCQFIVAVATSCHPQEEPMNDEDAKDNLSNSPKRNTGDARVFQGTARTLRSRTVDSN